MSDARFPDEASASSPVVDVTETETTETVVITEEEQYPGGLPEATEASESVEAANADESDRSNETTESSDSDWTDQPVGTESAGTDEKVSAESSYGFGYDDATQLTVGGITESTA